MNKPIIKFVFGILMLVLGIFLIAHGIHQQNLRQAEHRTKQYSVIKTTMEWAYFQGQREALEGDIRLVKTNGVWNWTKSCWDDGMQPNFNPAVSTNLGDFIKP